MAVAATTENPDAKKKITVKDIKSSYRIFRYLLPYKGTYIIGLFFLVLSTTSSVMIPFLFSLLVTVANEGQGYLYQKSFLITSITTIVEMLGVALLLQAIFSYIRVYTFNYVTTMAIADLRDALYQKILVLPISFFEERRVGELISRLTSDVSKLEETLSITLAEFLRQIATLLIGGFFLWHYSAKLTLIMMAVIPPIIVVLVIFGRFIRKLSKQAQDSLATSNVILDETFHAINIVKAFTNEKYEGRRYTSSLKEFIKASLRLNTFRGAFISVFITGIFGGIVLVLWQGALMVQQFHHDPNTGMDIGQLTGFVLYTIFIGGSLAGMSELLPKVQSTLGGTERLLEILDEPAEANLTGNNQGQSKLTTGDIAFKDVEFSYPTRKDIQILKKMNFTIKDGEKIALVGPSGAGKSTITQLLLGFYRIDSGDIQVNGQSVYQMGLENLRHNVGIVPQEVVLFGGTIRENIAYGKPGATDEEITEAAKKANAFNFISTFPEGLETRVGERGVKLSGGQKQRVAIARAILKDPSILVLDEATSSLDAESEILVQEALDELMKNRTSIVIAHRLSTIRKADRIFVINEGNIIETGSHDELIQNPDGLYNHLLKLQFQLK